MVRLFVCGALLLGCLHVGADRSPAFAQPSPSDTSDTSRKGMFAPTRFGDSKYFGLYGLNYILFGFGAEEGNQERPEFEYSEQVKFNVAVRYNMVSFLSEDRTRGDGTGIHFAYRQKSFWNLYDNSSPFYDLNYLPGGFLRYSMADFPAQLRGLGLPAEFAPALDVGYFHESNGRDGPANRSWNRITARLRIGETRSSRVSGSVAFWYVRSPADENADIEDVVGRGEVELHLAPFLIRSGRFGAISAHVRSALFGSTLARNVEANLMIHPTGALGKRIHPSLLIQYFRGFGENLLNYDEFHENVRVGITFIR